MNENLISDEKKDSGSSSKTIATVVGVLVAIAVAVALILVFTLKKDDNATPIEIYGKYTYLKGYNNETFISGNLEYNSTGVSSFYKNNKLSPIVSKLNFTATYDSEDELTIKITDQNNSRFYLPYQKPFPFTKTSPKLNLNPKYKIETSNDNSTFSFSVTRIETNEVIFNSKMCDFIFSDKYIQFGTVQPSQNIFGFGERAHKFLLGNGTFTVYSMSRFVELEKQTYGYHPVYLMGEKSKNFHIVYLRNTNGMDILVNGTSIIYKIIGGVLEFKIFLGDDNAETAIKKYHSYINEFAVMPFWSFGYHHCRWGYNTSKMVVEVAKNFTEYHIPIDTMWNDLDYMDEKADFTVDKKNFKKEEMDQLTAMNLHWVPLIDIGIKYDNKNEEIFIKGKNYGVYIMSNKTKEPLVNKVWPGNCTFVDYNHEKAEQFWGECMEIFHNSLNYSGLWLDMNEIEGFTAGEDINSPSNLRKLGKLPSEDLPYLPAGEALELKTLSIDGIHASKGPFFQLDTPLTEYNFHPLNGYLETIVTNNLLKSKFGKSLPFILTRSTFPGSGQYASHWTGDNAVDWRFLKMSIPGIFNFNLFGIPMTGSDICGFTGDSNEQICARWMQLGALYPFSRNHHAINFTGQEPWHWGNNSVVLKASLASLRLRYSILKFYYSLFVRKEGVGTIFRPLFFEFNQESLYEIENEFLIGNQLLVVPCIDENKYDVNAIFPKNVKFYEFFKGGNPYSQDFKASYKIEARNDTAAPIFIKEGTIVHRQNVEHVNRTIDLNNHFEFIIAYQSNDAESKFFKAVDQMLGINDYSEQFVVAKCLGTNNCIINISSSAVLSKVDTAYQLEVGISFTKLKAETVLEDIYLDAVTIYGIPKIGTNDYYSITTTFPQSKKIEVGVEISFILALN